MRRVIITGFLFCALICGLISGSARAQSVPLGYPACPSGSSTSCTLTVHVSTIPTPIFGKFAARTYLFIQNTGYTFSAGVPVINQFPVFCAVGSSNNPVSESVSGINVMTIEPGGTWEPTQIVKPQSSFTVPAGDVSCVAPLGDVWVTAEQE